MNINLCFINSSHFKGLHLLKFIGMRFHAPFCLMKYHKLILSYKKNFHTNPNTMKNHYQQRAVNLCKGILQQRNGPFCLSHMNLLISPPSGDSKSVVFLSSKQALSFWALHSHSHLLIISLFLFIYRSRFFSEVQYMTVYCCIFGCISSSTAGSTPFYLN